METSRVMRNRIASDNEPDYNFWAGKDQWQLVEAAKLVCGRDPLSRIPGRPRYNTEFKVIDIIDKSFAAVNAGKLAVVRDSLIPNYVILDPLTFLRWAADNALTIPPGLELLMAESEVVATDPDIQSELAKERAVAVARTLWLLKPAMTLAEVVSHQAIKLVVGDDRISVPQLKNWVKSYQPVMNINH